MDRWYLYYRLSLIWLALDIAAFAPCAAQVRPPQLVKGGSPSRVGGTCTVPPETPNAPKGGAVPLTFASVPWRERRNRFQHILQSVALDAGGLSEIAYCSLSGGSFHTSALARQAAAIARLICITTASILRLTTMSRLQRTAMPIGVSA